MHQNEKNKIIKDQIRKKYGTYENFAEKSGYSKMYISNVLNGYKDISEDMKLVFEEMLGNDIFKENANNEKDLFSWLFESSSLRDDLLKKARYVILDVFENIKMDDELIARVNQPTYEFIKSYKNY